MLILGIQWPLVEHPNDGFCGACRNWIRDSMFASREPKGSSRGSQRLRGTRPSALHGLPCCPSSRDSTAIAWNRALPTTLGCATSHKYSYVGRDLLHADVSQAP